VTASTPEPPTLWGMTALSEFGMRLGVAAKEASLRALLIRPIPVVMRPN